MKPLSKGTLEVLLEGRERRTINPCCYQRHRKALVARGLVSVHDRRTITPEGHEVIRNYYAKPLAQPLLAAKPKPKTHSVLDELLKEVEPRWRTHPQSIWNRARREYAALTGKPIPSQTDSYDPDNGTWGLG